MQELDPNQFKEIAPSESNVELDPSQFKPLPGYADGSSPLTPINKSPVDSMDRMKLSLGNEAGQMKYLKNKFEDVSKDKDGDLLVKDQGIWHRVDPKTLDAPDAWEASKIIANKIPGLTGTMMNVAGMELGAAAGSVVPGAGTVAGAGLGAGLSESLRISLGRLAGTYDATPEQTAKDIAWETLLASGGTKIALGVKPTLDMLKVSMKNMGDWGTNYAKENLSSLLGHLSEAGRWSTRRAMDSAESVIGKTDIAIKAIGNNAPRSEALDFAFKRQSNLVSTLAIESKQALQGNYRQSTAEILKEVPSNFSANIGDMMKGIKEDLANSGYGLLDKNGRMKILSDNQVAERLGTDPDKITKIIGENTRAALEQIAKISNQYGEYPTLKGVNGAKQLMDLRKSLSESFDDLFRPDVPQAIKRITQEVKDKMFTKMTQPFVDVNEVLGQKYISMNADYAAKKDAVDMLNDAVKNGQVDSVVKHLVSKSGSYNTFKGEAKSVADLLGQKGHKMINDVLDWEASKGFVDFVPKASGGSSLGYAVKAASTITGQNNPRMVGKEIQYGSKFLEFVKSLPPKQLKEFIGNDQNLAAAITPIMQAYDGEDKTIRGLLTNSGAIQNGNQ